MHQLFRTIRQAEKILQVGYNSFLHNDTKKGKFIHKICNIKHEICKNDKIWTCFKGYASSYNVEILIFLTQNYNIEILNL